MGYCIVCGKIDFLRAISPEDSGLMSPKIRIKI